eukprot:1141018-Pelagomonas_calceolata.AAC.5
MRAAAAAACLVLVFCVLGLFLLHPLHQTCHAFNDKRVHSLSPILKPRFVKCFSKRLLLENTTAEAMSWAPKQEATYAKHTCSVEVPVTSQQQGRGEKGAPVSNSKYLVDALGVPLLPKFWPC